MRPPQTVERGSHLSEVGAASGQVSREAGTPGTPQRTPPPRSRSARPGGSFLPEASGHRGSRQHWVATEGTRGGLAVGRSTTRLMTSPGPSRTPGHTSTGHFSKLVAPALFGDNPPLIGVPSGEPVPTALANTHWPGASEQQGAATVGTQRAPGSSWLRATTNSRPHQGRPAGASPRSLPQGPGRARVSSQLQDPGFESLFARHGCKRACRFRAHGPHQKQSKYKHLPPPTCQALTPACPPGRLSRCPLQPGLQVRNKLREAQCLPQSQSQREPWFSQVFWG